jgi:hypothetical protein
MQPSIFDRVGDGLGDEEDLGLTCLIALTSCIVNGILFVARIIRSTKASVKQIAIRVLIDLAIGE